MHTNIKRITILMTLILNFLFCSLTWASVFLSEEGIPASIRAVTDHPYAEAVCTVQAILVKDRPLVAAGVCFRIHPNVYVTTAHTLHLFKISPHVFVETKPAFDGGVVSIDETATHLEVREIVEHPKEDLALLFTARAHAGKCVPIQPDYEFPTTGVLTGISTQFPRLFAEESPKKLKYKGGLKHVFERGMESIERLEDGGAFLAPSPAAAFLLATFKEGDLDEKVRTFGQYTFDSAFGRLIMGETSTMASLGMEGDSGSPLFDRENHFVVAMLLGYHCIEAISDEDKLGVRMDHYLAFTRAVIGWINDGIRRFHADHGTVAYAPKAGLAGASAGAGAGGAAS